VFWALPVLVPPAKAGIASPKTMAAMPAKSSSLFKMMHFMRFPPLRYSRITTCYSVVSRIAPWMPPPSSGQGSEVHSDGLMNNSIELGGQDEPFLRSTTLNLHRKVRVKMPQMRLIYKELTASSPAPHHLAFTESGATSIHRIARIE
jgi:hypothetical protein